MKDFRRFAAGAAAILLAAGCSSDSPSDPSAATPAAVPSLAENAIPGQYIVVFRKDVSDAPGLARRLVQENGGRMRFSYQHAIKGFSAELSEAAVERLRAHPQVAYVEANAEVRLDDTQSPATWGLDRIDQRDLPLNNSYTFNTTASNVRAYILDTGILISHNEFGGRASVGFDAVGDGQNGIDCNGHGTHVAGTVGGSTYGVAKGVSLVAVRVLNCGGSGSTDGIIAGIDWVTANAVEPAVANMSLGGGFNQATNDAVTASINSGVSYQLSAGNGNFLGRPIDACGRSPASTPTATTVGATDINDHEASFSNYGTCVDILAPGVNITSAWIGSNSATNTISGTSMATPHVTGVAALYLAENAGATPAQVNSAIESNATPNTITLNSTTRGTPNLFLFSLFDDEPPPPGNQPPVANFTFSCATTSCTFTNTSTDPNGNADIVESRWSYGDGATQTVAGRGNGSHTYAAAGTYTVSLTVEDAAGATNTRTQSVRVRRR
jgi:subtilisin family serine protease